MRKQLFILLLFLSQAIVAQQITVLSTSITGRFDSCSGFSPTLVTATLMSSEGSIVEDGKLKITDPCGFSTVKIDMTGVRWDTNPNANWLHGIFFPTGSGITISDVNLPTGWIAQDSCTGASCSAQETGGPGFYYDGTTGNSCSECNPTNMDGQPWNNFGQSSMNCSTPFGLSFDMTFCNSEVVSGVQSFVLTGKPDGNTGCWGSPDVIEASTITFRLETVAAEVPLYDPVPGNFTNITECEMGPDGTILTYTAVLEGGCGDGNEVRWYDEAEGGELVGVGSPFYYQNPDGSCPAGKRFYAQCCPDEQSCSRHLVVVSQCLPPDYPPTFAEIPPLCPDSENPLPETSLEGYTGTWSPAFDPNNSGTYQFLPDPNQCATYPVQIEITILPVMTPTFDEVPPLCQDSVPPNLPPSNEGAVGQWSPAVIDTSVPGTYDFTFVPDESCFEEVTIQVTIVPTQTPEFNNLEYEFCQDDEVPTLPGTSDNGITGVWFPAIIDTSTPGTVQYTFTPNPEEECAEPTNIFITINETITPEFTFLLEYCQNSTPPALPLTSDNGITGSWSPATIDTSAPGTVQYIFTPDENQGCTTVITRDISITTEIIPQFSIPQQFCLGATAPALPGNSNNGIPGSWSPATIDTNNIGTVTYTFTPSPSAECALPRTIDITIIDLTVPQFNIEEQFCFNSAAPALPLTSNNGIAGTWFPASIDTNTLGTTLYTFTSDPNDECADNFSIEITVVDQIFPEFVLPEDICQSSIEPALPTLSDNGISGVWSPATIDTQSPGTFTYTFTPNPNEPCAQVITREITVTSSIIPEFEFESTYCQGAEAEILPNTSINGIQGTWFPAEIITTGSSEYTFTPNEGEMECAVPVTIPVEVIGTPNILGFNIDGSNVTVSVQGGDNTEVEYSLDGIFWQSSPYFPNLTPGETYTIYVREAGCAISSKNVTILFVPNFISPNNDGINDFWEIRGIAATPEATIKIFDRFGKIFVNTNFTGDYKWDGKYLGRNVSSGDYWYIIDIPGDANVTAQKFVGHVSVKNQ